MIGYMGPTSSKLLFKASTCSKSIAADIISSP
jgi:hypothetical protein